MDKNVTPVDPKLFEELGKAIAFAIKNASDAPLSRQDMTAVAALRAPGKSTIPVGIGYAQSESIGGLVAPSVSASPDGNETAAYQVFNKEAFFGSDMDVVAIGGGTRTSDVEMSWASVSLDVHAHQVIADPREIRIAAANGVDLAAMKYDLAKAKVELTKEIATANFFGTRGNYGSYVGLTSGGTGTAWSNPLASGGVFYSNPIADVATQDEVIRGRIGKRGNTLLLSPLAFKALRFHPLLTSLINYAGTGTAQGMPISLEMLAALFGKRLIVGDAIKTTTLNGSFSDVWAGVSNQAALLYVAGASLYAPQFALNLASSGYPKTKQFVDENKGAEGSTVYRYIDAYKVVGFMSGAAGVLFEGAGQ